RRLVMALPRIWGSAISMAILIRSNPMESATWAGYLPKNARTPNRLRAWKRAGVGFGSAMRRAATGPPFKAREFSQSRYFATKIFTRSPRAATLRPMNSPEYTARRATVDDLSGLKILWERARFQVLDLEKRLTEFQLIVSDAGDLIGALALHIEAKQGLLHSGAFAQPEQEEQFRPQLWERIQSVARNHGLNRLWTQEGAPFWLQAGFVEGSSETLPRLPPGFGDRQARWLTLQLKDENVAALSIEP